jgi:hypothetical protein
MAQVPALDAPITGREAALLPSRAPSGTSRPRPTESPAEQSAAKPLSPAKAERDHRLDFWRGLCLIDMLVVHLIHQGMSLGNPVAGKAPGIDLWIGEYTRFAAGGFIFIAGLSIGRIFLPRARDPEKRWTTYRALWKRSLVILAVHYIAEVGFLVMWPLFGGVPFKRIGTPILDILLFRAGYDLLPFYVVMVALAPLMLELVRRGLWWALALASMELFFWAHMTGAWHTYALPIQHDFFPILWQVIFVAGVIAGEFLPKYDRLSVRPKVYTMIGLWLAQIVLFIAYYGPNFDLRLWLPLEFAKVPLTTGETLRYLTLILAIMATTDLAWSSRLAGGKVARFCERLGRNSLAVYVFHVWMVQVIVRIAPAIGPAAGRIALAIVGVGALWLFAYALELGGAKRKKRKPARAPPLQISEREPTKPRRPLWRMPLAVGGRPIGALPAMAAGTIVALWTINHQQAAFTRRHLLSHHGMPSPAGDLLKDRNEDFFGESFIPDPIDEPDEEEEIPVMPRERVVEEEPPQP